MFSITTSMEIKSIIMKVKPNTNCNKNNQKSGQYLPHKQTSMPVKIVF